MKEDRAGLRGRAPPRGDGDERRPREEDARRRRGARAAFWTRRRRRGLSCLSPPPCLIFVEGYVVVWGIVATIARTDEQTDRFDRNNSVSHQVWYYAPPPFRMVSPLGIVLPRGGGGGVRLQPPPPIVLRVPAGRRHPGEGRQRGGSDRRRREEDEG